MQIQIKASPTKIILTTHIASGKCMVSWTKKTTLTLDLKFHFFHIRENSIGNKPHWIWEKKTLDFSFHYNNL
jgi:hypothetical protein